MRRSKIAALAAVLSVFLAVTPILGGCGKQEDNPDAIYISIQNEGYGYRWLEAAADLYTSRTGVNVEVTPVSIKGQLSNQLLSDKNNHTDLYFNISEAQTFFGNLGQGSAVIDGYDTVFVDISDVYEHVPEGYGNNKPIRELITPYALRSNTYNGKQYGFSWSNGINGLVYNADLFEEFGIEKPPRTTDELLEISRNINGKYQTENGRTIYAFNWSMGYWYHLTMLWWFQYEGADAYYAYCEGKDTNGVYTADILQQRGKYYAYQIIEDIIDIEKGVSNPNCTSYSFTQSQLRFLEGEALMMPNGDWLEREMESNFEPGEVTIKMMKTPVNSHIIEKLPKKTITSDPELREVIDYIDNGMTGTLSKAYAQEDIDYVYTARHMISSQCNMHQAYIPSYSNNIEGTKDFIKFLYSKDAQELIMRTSYGNSFSVVGFDFTQEPFYTEMSPFKKSIDEILYDPDVFMINKEIWAPMYYLGGLFHQVETQQVMAIDHTSPTYRDAAGVCLDHYNEIAPIFDDIMVRAGVHN